VVTNFHHYFSRKKGRHNPWIVAKTVRQYTC